MCRRTDGGESRWRTSILALTLGVSILLAGCTPMTGVYAPPPVAPPAEITTPAAPVAPPAPVVPEPVLLPAFIYHHVKPTPDNFIAISPATFEAHLQTIARNGYTPITVTQYAQYLSEGATLPPNPVMITFDDGWGNQYKYALPLLKKYGFSATFFIYPKVVGKGSFMTQANVDSLVKDGFDVQPHTWGHVPLVMQGSESAAAASSRLASQFKLSNDWVKRTTGRAPVALAYPYGHYDGSTTEMAAAAGYLLAVTVDEAPSVVGVTPPYLLKRFSVFKTDSIASFETRLTSRPFDVLGMSPAPGQTVAHGATVATVTIGAADVDPQSLTVYADTVEVKPTIVQSGDQISIGIPFASDSGFRYVWVRGVDGQGRTLYASWGFMER